MQNYEIAYNNLIEKIKSTRRKENIFLFLNGLLLNLGISLISLFIAIIIESIAFGDTSLRTALFGFVFITFVVSFGVLVVPHLMRLSNLKNNPSINELALRIGLKFPDMDDKLCNALQLIPISKNPQGMSPTLALAAFQSYYESIHQRDFDVIINKDEFKRNIIIFLLPLFLLVGSISLFQSTLGDSLYRLANFNKSFLPPVPFHLEVIPASALLARGDKLHIEIKITGTIPAKVWLSTKEEFQTEFDSFEIRPNTEGKYIFEINPVKSSIEYFAHTEWYSERINSNHGFAKVIEKPIIKSITGRLVYPSYANLNPKFIDEKSADITALKGSKLNLELISNKEIKSAKLTFIKKNISSDSLSKKSDTSFISLAINGKKATGGLIVGSTGVYYIQIEDKDTYINENPINYSIIALNDDFPEISMLEPLSDIEINSNGLLSLKCKISDDYGFGNLKLFYRLAESPYTSPDQNYSSVDIKFVKNDLTIEVPYIWDLNKINIMPDEKFEFYLEISDNDIISGPKKSKTQLISLRLPSLKEIQREADVVQEQVQKNLEKLMKDALDVKKEIDEFNREMLKEKNPKKEADWKDKKKAEDISKKQSELKDKLNDVQKKLEETTKNLQENSMISQETLEKYMELQKLLKQVDTPELRMMQQKMQDALKNMTQDQLQKAMENFKFNEEQFRQSIERSMQLLKRIQAEQKTDGLKKRAEELAKQQDELAEQTQKSNPNDKETKNQLSIKQEKLKKELNNLNKDLEDLEKQMKEIGSDQMPMEELNQSKDALKNEETSSEMQSSKESMKEGNFNKSQKSQKKASQNLKNFAQKMSKMKESMRRQSTEETINKMQKSISDLLELSKRQETIKNQTENSDFNSTALPQFAQSQAQTFESLANVAKAMSELSKKSFAITPEMGVDMSKALQQMREAVEKMADRNTKQAAQAQQQAMSGMNKTAGQMQKMMDALKEQNQGSCNNPGGSGAGEGEGNPQNMGQGMSFSQRMQQIAAEQQAVNQAMQQMMQGGSGQGKEQLEKQAQQSRLSDKQGAAQKSIDELAKEQKKFSGDKKKLGELEKISEEMKEIMTDIDSRGVTPETMKKQERILSRLLDLQKSDNERDFEKKREGKTSSDLYLDSPSSLDFNNIDDDKIFRDVLRNNQQGFSKDYEDLIKLYFEKLKLQN